MRSRAKNVTPILYRGISRHAYLHKTLRAWADTYRDGARGKERIVVDYAMARPDTATGQDNFVSRVTWALSDPSGRPAMRFADLNPVPSLDWLEPLAERRFGHADLIRFGIPPKASADKNLAFSLTRRPLPGGFGAMARRDGGVEHGAQYVITSIRTARLAASVFVEEARNVGTHDRADAEMTERGQDGVVEVAQPRVFMCVRGGRPARTGTAPAPPRTSFGEGQTRVPSQGSGSGASAVPPNLGLGSRIHPQVMDVSPQRNRDTGDWGDSFRITHSNEDDVDADDERRKD